MELKIVINKLIASIVGAGLAPPGNKTENSNTGRPRTTPTMYSINFANES